MFKDVPPPSSWEPTPPNPPTDIHPAYRKVAQPMPQGLREAMDIGLHQATAEAEAQASPATRDEMLPLFPSDSEVKQMRQELNNTSQVTSALTRFHKHVSQASNDNTTPLFPNNPMFGEETCNDLLTQESLKRAPVVGNPTKHLREEWSLQVTNTLNFMGEEHYRLFNLILHSIAQNNILASFMAPTLHNIKKRLQNVGKLVALSNLECIKTTQILEHLEALFGDVISGKTGQQGPPPPSTSQKDKINLITWKVMAIEQKVETVKTAGNPPGPQNKTQKTEGTQGVKQKDANEKN